MTTTEPLFTSMKAIKWLILYRSSLYFFKTIIHHMPWLLVKSVKMIGSLQEDEVCPDGPTGISKPQLILNFPVIYHQSTTSPTHEHPFPLPFFFYFHLWRPPLSSPLSIVHLSNSSPTMMCQRHYPSDYTTITTSIRTTLYHCNKTPLIPLSPPTTLPISPSNAAFASKIFRMCFAPHIVKRLKMQ